MSLIPILRDDDDCQEELELAEADETALEEESGVCLLGGKEEEELVVVAVVMLDWQLQD